MKRVLLVEDEPGLVMTLTDRLTHEDYAVDASTDGESGLERASAEDARDIGRRSDSQTWLEHLIAKESEIHRCEDGEKSLSIHDLPPL